MSTPREELGVDIQGTLVASLPEKNVATFVEGGHVESEVLNHIT